MKFIFRKIKTFFTLSNNLENLNLAIFVTSFKTSPKGFSASKCDEGNWIFSKKFEKLFEIFWIFFWNFFGIFWEDFLGGNFLEGMFWEDFFGRNFLGGIFERNLLGGIF